MAYAGDPVRVLVIPGLHDSGPAHWQTWLESRLPHALRVCQDDWTAAELDRWAERIEATLATQPPARWIAVAHSFGCLALARQIDLRAAGRDSGIRAALFVAPADPAKFGVEADLPNAPLGVPSTLLASRTDPWMRIDAAHAWARRWGSRFIDLGDVGHINTDSGFGPLPPAIAWVDAMRQRLDAERRIERAHPAELSFAV